MKRLTKMRYRSNRRWLLATIACFTCLVLPAPTLGGGVLLQSGHHFASGRQRDDAFIGIDFGRNSFGGRSVAFRTSGGRVRLRTALADAVAVGERRMSFDFAFDFRSVIERDSEGRLRLDDEVMPSVDVFLEEVEAADVTARRSERRFGVDVVLMDYRLADGVRTESDPGSGDIVTIGEFPEFLTDSEVRTELLEVLEPVLERLGRNPLVTLNLMNEPEFIALPASEVQARLQSGQWRSVVTDAALAAKGSSFETVELIRMLPPELALTVHRQTASGQIVLSQSEIPPDAVLSFLKDLYDTIERSAPNARVTVGWADDRSALSQTTRLEQVGSFRIVTDVVSFHVYPAFGRGLTTTRRDFTESLGDRPVRVTEWGLGSPGDLVGAMADALVAADSSGLDGVLFWWDDAHAFSHDAFRSAADGLDDPVADPGDPSPDFDGDGRVDFNDFIAFASRFGSSVGEDGFDSRFDLDQDRVIGFGDFLLFVAAFGR